MLQLVRIRNTIRDGEFYICIKETEGGQNDSQQAGGQMHANIPDI